MADHYKFSNTSVFLLRVLYYNLLSSSSLAPSIIFPMCLEYFLFGKIFVLCALTCTLAKVVDQLLLVLGVYSGIFAIYLQCPSKESRTAIIVFYVLCRLYVLSAATVVCDLLNTLFFVSKQQSILSIRISFLIFVMQMRISTLPFHNSIDWQSMLFRTEIVEITIYGCCDFIVQCIMVCIKHCISSVLFI